MPALTSQGLPHDIPIEASADYSHAGWESGFELDGSGAYVYTAGDGEMLVIRTEEVFCGEPNEDLSPEVLNYWAADQRYFTWRGGCCLYGNPQ